MIIDEWALNKENSQLEQHFMRENAGRYPMSFRHYENYANYKVVNPEAEIEEYTEIMNTQVEWETYLAITREAALEESLSNEFIRNHELPKDYDDPNDVPIQDIINSEMFSRDARCHYEGKIQQALLRGQWFTLADALDDTVDMIAYGKSHTDWPLKNVYIPVRHNIMPKPNMQEHIEDELGYHFGKDTYDGLRVNPIQQANPLKGYKMNRMGPIRKWPTADNYMISKFGKYRRISHMKRRYLRDY